MKFKYDLGAKLRDSISGFEGIAVSRSQFLNGCIRYGISPTVLKDGRPVEDAWFDEQQLVLVHGATVPEGKPAKVGGTRPAPPATPDPK